MGEKMKLLRLFIVIVAVFPWAISPSYGVREKKLPNRTITVMQPGVGIGNISIGDDLSLVIEKMGYKPSGGKTVKTGSLTEYWIDYSDLGITFIFTEDKRLVRVAASNPGIVVGDTDIRVNTSARELLRAYGAGRSEDLKEGYERITYDEQGVSFTINATTQRIETIVIQKPMRPQR
jgi:hypothetical protein